MSTKHLFFWNKNRLSIFPGSFELMNLSHDCNNLFVSERMITYKKHSRIEKGKTDEHSKIPDPGTTDSKVLNIRDTYARGGMNNRAVE